MRIIDYKKLTSLKWLNMFNVLYIDKNGDNKVSKSEFDGPTRHFDRLDRDKDGFLSEDEAPKGPPPLHQGQPRK